VLLVLPNLMQTYLNLKIKRREGSGLLQKWYHVGLVFGASVSFTASILLNQSTGGIIAAISTSLNDVLAWLFSITLASTALVELQISYHTVNLVEFPKWPGYVIYSGNVLTIILWLLAVIFMSVAKERTVYKFPCYFTNSLCLFVLTVTIFIASWKLIAMNNQVEKDLVDCQKLGSQDKTEKVETRKRMLTFKIFTGSVISVALFVMGWNLYSASRLIGSNSFYIQDQRSYSSVATSVATRFIGFLVMAYFTYRMWLWEGVPCSTRAVSHRGTVASTTQKTPPKRGTHVSTRSYGGRGSITATRNIPEPSQRRSSHTTTVAPMNAVHLSPPSAHHHIHDHEQIHDLTQDKEESHVALEQNSDIELKPQTVLRDDFVLPSPSNIHSSGRLHSNNTNPTSNNSFISSESIVPSYIESADHLPLSDTNLTLAGSSIRMNTDNDNRDEDIEYHPAITQQISSSVIDPEETGVLRSSIASESEFKVNHLDT